MISKKKLNDKKFEALRYGPDEVLKLCTSYLTPSGTIITEKDELRDLGVTMSSNCKFDSHITNIINSSKNMMSWILRSFHTRDKDHMLLFWKTYVRPILEYCSVLWCPTNAGNIQRIESLQWSFLRKIKSNLDKVDLDYWGVIRDIYITRSIFHCIRS